MFNRTGQEDDPRVCDQRQNTNNPQIKFYCHGNQHENKTFINNVNNNFSMARHKFVEGEKVLCFHGPLIYEAKCLKCRTNPKSTEHNEYFVHYAGWSKKWDDWVPETRILKYTDANLAHQMELDKSHTGDKKSKHRVSKAGRSAGSKLADAQESATDSMDPDSRSSTPILDSRSRGKNNKRRGNSAPDILEKTTKKQRWDHPIENEEQFLGKVEVKIKLPDELKPWLVDDNIAIVKKKKLHVLPAKITVDQILENWVKSKKSKNLAAICGDVSTGVRSYFNAMLPYKLLYKMEREQFNEVLAVNNASPSAIYGASHLLRLFKDSHLHQTIDIKKTKPTMPKSQFIKKMELFTFTIKIGHVLAYTAINEKTMSLVLSTFQDLLRFMVTNIAIYFSPNNYQQQ